MPRLLTRQDVIHALLRPGMYTGDQGSRTMTEWYADAVVAYLEAKGRLDPWRRTPDGRLRPFISIHEYENLREDDRFLYNYGPKPEGLT